MTELEHELMKSLEELNLKYIDLQNSKEMRVGRNVLSIKNAIKKARLSDISLILKKRRGQKKLTQNILGRNQVII